MATRALYGTALLNRNSDDWANSMIHDIVEMIKLPLQYHLSEQNGEKIKLIDRGSEAVWETGDIFLLEFIPYVLLSILLIIWGFFINVTLTFVCISFLPFAFIIARHFWITAHKNQRSANKLWDKLHWRINDTLTNISLIKMLAREKHEKEYIASLYKDASEKQKVIRIYWLRNSSFGRIIKIIPRIITLAFSVYLFSKNEITLWTLFFFFAYTDTLYSPIYGIVEKYQQMMQSFAKFEDLQETIAQDKEIDMGKKLLKWIEKSIRFENLSFSYPNTTREVLKGINFEIQKWQKIALIGHTGSGKSTIIQILMRFYQTSGWSIQIDGKDIYDFSLESYRKHFGAVFQDTTLFNESIRHNLEYVRNGITKSMIEEACKKANIWSFIESLPSWLDTEVWERWLKLSGWEKQRLAIARAILVDPEVLILDEATSALDTKTERLVQKAFDNLMKGRTSIIIAHRLSTIQHVDCIYLLEKGRIIWEWSHDELYKVSPIYREMVDLQKDGFLKEKE
jgi:ATP-binding cassette, subfamily B, putative efflux pump